MLRRILRTIAIIAAAFGLAAGGFLACVPFADGPVLLFAGGRLHGEVETGPEPDWSFAEDVNVVELQVNPEDPRSVNVGIIVLGGEPYVPATLRPAEKRWPGQLEADDRVLVRVNGRIFSRRAKRVGDAGVFDALIAKAVKKYDPSYFEPERTWFFRLESADAVESGR